jgi:ribosomal RNA-processing protein 17
MIVFFLKATKTYENDDLKVTVVTKEINPEEESFPSERKEAAPGVSPHPIVADKKKSVPINKKKPFKKVAKNKSQPKQRSKRDKRKGKKPGRK